MEKLGMKQSRLDPALFYKCDEEGELIGLTGSHVDDFAITGTKLWQEDQERLEIISARKDRVCRLSVLRS